VLIDLRTYDIQLVLWLIPTDHSNKRISLAKRQVKYLLSETKIY